MTETIHSARSPAFLSRLYDGEVHAAERAAFDAHRSACDECRRAADTFAATLAAFRASPTTPAAADLSARILRKIRAQSPSRRPFGVMFGIDIRWAGIFVAALLVVLISAPALFRRPEAPAATATPASIPARILDAGPSNESARAPQPPGRGAAGPRAPAPIAAASQAAKDEATTVPPSAPAVAVAGSPSEEQKARSSRAAAARAKAAAPVLSKQMTTADPAGVEAGVANTTEAVAPAPRLSVRALDGQGEAPALISHLSDERFAPLRGFEFVLVVENGGRVREVLPAAGDGVLARRESSSAQAIRTGAVDALRALQFAPGDRPRRLLVRVE